MLEVRLSNLVAIINDDNIILYENGVNIGKEEIEKIKKSYIDINSVYKNGIIIKGEKYIIINVENEDSIKYLHCKKYDEGYICIYMDNIMIVVNYENEILPSQYALKIEKLIKQLTLKRNLLMFHQSSPNILKMKLKKIRPSESQVMNGNIRRSRFKIFKNL